MSRTLQFKRKSNTAITGITGANGEIIVDDTNYTLTVHDGVTPGGTRLATEEYVTDLLMVEAGAVTGSNGRIVISGPPTALNVDLATIPGITPGSYSNPIVSIDAYGRVSNIASQNVSTQNVVSSINGHSGAINILGPYANDFTAALHSVPVGGLYYDSTGIIHIRLI